MASNRIGMQIGAATSPADLASIAGEVERLGYGEIWLAEDYFRLGGIASAALSLSATAAIPVGLGVVAGPVRHPAVTAMEFATLGAAWPGRFMGGLGHGAPGWMRQMGLTVSSPLRLLREVTESVRKLLAGAELEDSDGRFKFEAIRLARPDESVPLYLGVHGPASLRLSGELADGTLLGWFSSPGYVEWARDRVNEGMGRSDRDEPHRLVALCLLDVSQSDPAGARRRFAQWAAPMLRGMVESPQLDPAVAGIDVAEPLMRFDEGHVTGLKALLNEVAAVGDLESCAATIARLREAGADQVVLVPNPAGRRTTQDMVDQIRVASALTAV